MATYLESRWTGEVPLETVFWRDMLVVGTAVNVASAVLALVLFALDAPALTGIAALLLPLPWNVFLLFAVWRSAEREGGPAAFTARVVSALWFFVMLVV